MNEIFIEDIRQLKDMRNRYLLENGTHLLSLGYTSKNNRFCLFTYNAY